MRQLRDAVAEILLAGHELGGRIGQRVDAAAHEQLERFPRAQPLARLERCADPPPGVLEQRQLRVDLPLVGEEGRASLRQGERATGPLDFRQRGAELADGRVHRPPGSEREPEPRVEAPRHLRRDAPFDQCERRAIERLGDSRRPGSGFERRTLSQRSGFSDRVAHTLQI